MKLKEDVETVDRVVFDYARRYRLLKYPNFSNAIRMLNWTCRTIQLMNAHQTSSTAGRVNIRNFPPYTYGELSSRALSGSRESVDMCIIATCQMILSRTEYLHVEDAAPSIKMRCDMFPEDGFVKYDSLAFIEYITGTVCNSIDSGAYPYNVVRAGRELHRGKRDAFHHSMTIQRT